MKEFIINKENKEQGKLVGFSFLLMIGVFVGSAIMLSLKINHEVQLRNKSVYGAILDQEPRGSQVNELEGLAVLEDTLMNIIVPVYGSAEVEDDINLAAIDVFVAHMKDDLSANDLNQIQGMIKKRLNYEDGLMISNSIAHSYKLKTEEQRNNFFILDASLMAQSKLEYEHIRSLNPKAFVPQ